MLPCPRCTKKGIPYIVSVRNRKYYKAYMHLNIQSKCRILGVSLAKCIVG
jgi:hypothetical protein